MTDDVYHVYTRARVCACFVLCVSQNYSPSSKSMAPYMQTLSRTGEFKRIRFLRVDIEAVPAVAEKCNVKALPTYQIYKNGEKLEEMSGALPSKLVAMMKEHNFKPKQGGLKKIVGVVLGITFGVFGLIKLKAGVEAAEKAAEERKELEKRAAEERARRERDALRQQRARSRGVSVPQQEEEDDDGQFEEEDDDEEYEYYDDDEDE